MTEHEAIARAKAYAEQRGWAWVEPARATRMPSRQGAHERWEVWSHSKGGLGAMARIVIDGETGEILDQGYISR